MSKFNQKAVGSSNAMSDSVNQAGGVSYSHPIKHEIASVVLSTMVYGDSYYESEKDRLACIEQMLDNPEIAEFVAKTMVYARNVGNLRSISHYLAGILSEKVKGSNYLRSALRKSFIRPDDLTETLALWNSRNKGKMVPNSLRRAFKDALETYDNYQLKKYKGARSAVKLRDVVKLAHPKGDFKALIEGTLENVQTAQTVNAGSTGEARAENYKSMLQNHKLGYMAALKNIKNILESGADVETVDMLCSLLRNEKACLGSRVLPFRFTQAYGIVNEMNIDRLMAKKIQKAIEDGFILSARNIPIVEGNESVAILLDESDSMNFYFSEDMPLMTPFMVGKTLMASMLTGLDKSNVVGYLWADHAREVSVDGSPFEFIKNTNAQGMGTDVWAAIAGLIKSQTKVDKLVILTDMQMYSVGSGYNSTRREFKDMVKEYRKISPNVKVLFWNLEGYGGGTPMKLDHDILEVSGFYDKMMGVAAKIWKDKDALVKEIEAIEL